MESQKREAKTNGGLKIPIMDLSNQNVGEIKLHPFHHICYHHDMVSSNNIILMSRAQSSTY